MSDATPTPLPRRWPWLIAWFRWYTRGFVRKHFHAVRLSRSGGRPTLPDLPIIIVMNHPSWWDPMVAIQLLSLFPNRQNYAVIESAQLQRYRMFGRMGFFGIDPNTMQGAFTLLRTAQVILEQPTNMLWITAQGQFRDVRERPLALQQGIGLLAHRLEHGIILPLAIEYSFWTERDPEALLRFGEPLDMADHPEWNIRKWTEQIEAHLTQAQDILSAETMTRDPAAFETLLVGRAGVGGIYDRWRRFRAWLAGESFDREHGGKS